MQLNSPKLLSFTFNGKTYSSNEDQNNNTNNTKDCEHHNEKTVTVEYLIDNLSQSKIIQNIEFNNNQITFSTKVNWLEHDKLLKVSFPTRIRNRNAKFGIQFGHIERPTHKNTTRDMAKYEVFGRWADLSDSTGGVTISSDIKCGYDVHDGEMMLSLLKAPNRPDKWCDYGWRKFIYKVDFHADSFDAARATKMSDELNYPIISPCNVEKVQKQLNSESFNFTEFVLNSSCSFIDGKFVEIKNEFENDSDICGVILETLKPSKNRNGFVARFYEAKGGWEKVKVSFPLLQKGKWNVSFIDFYEKIISENEIKLNDSMHLEFSIEFKPFQVISIQINELK